MQRWVYQPSVTTMGQQCTIIILYERNPRRIGHLGDSGVATWPIFGHRVTHADRSNAVTDGTHVPLTGQDSADMMEEDHCLMERATALAVPTMT